MKTDFFYRIARPFAVSAAWFLLRVWLGAAMMFHGWDELFGTAMPSFIRHLQAVNIPFPFIVGYLIVFVQVFGGLLFIMGAFGRIVALLLACVACASLFEHIFILSVLASARQIELSLLYSLLTILFAVVGPGSFSIDAYFASRYLQFYGQQTGGTSLRDVFGM